MVRKSAIARLLVAVQSQTWRQKQPEIHIEQENKQRWVCQRGREKVEGQENALMMEVIYDRTTYLLEIFIHWFDIFVKTYFAFERAV